MTTELGDRVYPVGMKFQMLTCALIASITSSSCSVESVSTRESDLLTTGYVHCGVIGNCSLDSTSDSNNKSCAGVCNVTSPGSQYNSAGCSVEPDPNSHNNGVIGWCSYKP